MSTPPAVPAPGLVPAGRMAAGRMAAGWVRPAPGGARRLRTRLGAYRPELLTAALCAVVVLAGVQGPDLPAQDYRSWLFRAHGPVLWDAHWYGGHLLPGYSLLAPPLSALVGTTTVLVGACLASTTCLRLLLAGREHHRRPATWYFAAATVADLVVGRAPFALSLALGLAALLGLRRERRRWAAAAALGAGLASPLGALFLLLVAVALTADASRGWRYPRPLAAAGGGLMVSAVFGEGGTFPFPVGTFLGCLVFVAAGLWLAPRSERVLRRGLVLYGAACVAAFVVPNPVGGNMARVGGLLCGPAALVVLLRHRRVTALLALLGPLLWWTLTPVASALADSHDPSAVPGYYTGLVTAVRAQRAASGDLGGRLEVPFTRDHWEADLLARQVPIARGWERQLDYATAAVLYAPLTAAAYRGWLDSNAVDLVALPDVALDQGGRAEADLLTAHRPGWLTRVWSDAHWQLFAVSHPTPLVSGDARLQQDGVAALTLRFTRPGTALVHERWSRFWRAGSLLNPGHPELFVLTPTADGWLQVQSTVAGAVRLSVSLPLLPA